MAHENKTERRDRRVQVKHTCTGKREEVNGVGKKVTRKAIGRFGSRESLQIESDVCFRNIGHFVQRRISIKISKDSGKIV